MTASGAPRERDFWLGLLPPFAIGAFSVAIGTYVPVLGAPVVAIVLGLLLGEFIGQPEPLKAGTAFCANKVLQTAIVLFGAGMSLQQVATVGARGLPVMLGTIAVALTSGAVLVRLLGIERTAGSLVTYGTTICGASAIATMSVVIGADASAVAVSIAVIVLYNLLAAIVFPYLGQAMGLSPESFGLWAGTAVNDTSSVVAAATSYDALLVAAGLAAGATAYAVVVKLTRTLALIPMALWESARERRADPDAAGGKAWWRLVPPFLVLFLLAAAVRTTGVIPGGWDKPIAFLAHAGTAVAMAAVGMSSSFQAVRRAGWRPVALGGILWLVVAVSSLLLQSATGQLGRLGP